MQLVAIDIGGTHARFALAAIAPDGGITLGEPVTLATSDFASLQTAWEEFERRCGCAIPRSAAIAIAGLAGGGWRWKANVAAAPGIHARELTSDEHLSIRLHMQGADISRLSKDGIKACIHGQCITPIAADLLQIWTVPEARPRSHQQAATGLEGKGSWQAFSSGGKGIQRLLSHDRARAGEAS